MIFTVSLALAVALQTSGVVAGGVDQASQPAPRTNAVEAPSPVPQPDANGVYHCCKGLTPPEVTHQVEPKYSDAVGNMKFSGEVVVGLVVDSKGKPAEIHIV